MSNRKTYKSMQETKSTPYKDSKANFRKQIKTITNYTKFKLIKFFDYSINYDFVFNKNKNYSINRDF